MNAAIIGASEEALHTIEKSHEHGLKVIALDGNPKAAGLRMADEAVVVDISDENLVIEAMKEKRADFLLTVPIGRYLTATGAVNDALNLPGLSRKMAVLCTDKLKFHERMQEAGLRQCRCYEWDKGRLKAAGSDAAKEKEDLLETDIPFPELSFPAILKPRYGSGSRGIHIAFDREQLKEALGEVSGEPYVLEEWIAGEEYGVDGAVTEKGFQMVLLRRKENTPLPARQAVGYFSVSPSEEFWKQVKEYMSAAVKCLGLRECLLHADIIRSAKGPFAIEISARPSGHNLHNLFTPLCTGVDMAEEYIKYRLGLPYNFIPHDTRAMMIHYFDLQGKVTHVPRKEQVEEVLEAKLLAWQCNIREGEELGRASDGHSLMGRGYFVLEGGDEAFLKEQGERVKELFEEERSLF